MTRRILQAAGFLLGLGLALAGLGPLASAARTPPAERFARAAGDGAALEAALNAARLARGRPALHRSADLDALAAAWAARLVERAAHPETLHPDRSPLPWNAGALGAGEDPAALAARWLAASASRERVLDPRHDAAGLGFARRPDGALLWVQVYAEGIPPTND